MDKPSLWVLLVLSVVVLTDRVLLFLEHRRLPAVTTRSLPWSDEDKDGVMNAFDRCPGSWETDRSVLRNGCLYEQAATSCRVRLPDIQGDLGGETPSMLNMQLADCPLLEIDDGDVKPGDIVLACIMEENRKEGKRRFSCLEGRCSEMDGAPCRHSCLSFSDGKVHDISSECGFAF